jgi:hypothetical protein
VITRSPVLTATVPAFREVERNARASATQLPGKIAILTLDDGNDGSQLTNQFQNQSVNMQHEVGPFIV